MAVVMIAELHIFPCEKRRNDGESTAWRGQIMAMGACNRLYSSELLLSENIKL